jgi:hypothetical protein
MLEVVFERLAAREDSGGGNHLAGDFADVDGLGRVKVIDQAVMILMRVTNQDRVKIDIRKIDLTMGFSEG